MADKLIGRAREFREAARRVRPHPANPHVIDAAEVARFVDTDCALIAQCLDEAAQAIAALTAENERLKLALTRIKCLDVSYSNTKIATEALKGGPANG